MGAKAQNFPPKRSGYNPPTPPPPPPRNDKIKLIETTIKIDPASMPVWRRVLGKPGVEQADESGA